MLPFFYEAWLSDICYGNIYTWIGFFKDLEFGKGSNKLLLKEGSKRASLSVINDTSYYLSPKGDMLRAKWMLRDFELTFSVNAIDWIHI